MSQSNIFSDKKEEQKEKPDDDNAKEEKKPKRKRERKSKFGKKAEDVKEIKTVQVKVKGQEDADNANVV